MLKNFNMFYGFEAKTNEEKKKIIDLYKERRNNRPLKKQDWENLFKDKTFLSDRKLFSMPIKKAFSKVRRPDDLKLFKNTLILDQSQREMIGGLMLGDLGMRKSGNDWGFKFCQADNRHKAYAFHLYDQLYYYSLSMPQPYLRLNSLAWQWDTITHNNFNQIRADWFDQQTGKKIIPKNFEVTYLTDRALAYWFMDDGYLLDPKKIGKAVAFATHGFTETEVQKLSDSLNAKYNWNTRLGNNKGKKVIIVPGEHDKEFLERIMPHYHQSMNYKLPTPRKPKKL